MKTLYLQCDMGASGNMLLGALLGLLDDGEKRLETLNGLGLPGVRYHCERAAELPGNLVTVTVDGHEEEEEHAHHHGSTLPEILARIAALPLSRAVRDQAAKVYGSIAEAEAEVHGTAPSEVHFHEVGSLDAVADVVGVCYLLEAIGAEKVCCSPIHVGSGTVRCAHGVLPVPAPATELLLRGIPWYTGKIETELCTPTGAALLRQLAGSFGPMPALRVERTGCGFGTKRLSRPNCLRAFLGETAESVYELRCNLDDMTPEELSFVRERLEENGALDVTMISAQMKKNRPGVLLCCLCREDRRDETIRLLLRHTTTGGVRYVRMERAVLETKTSTVETAYGPVRQKTYSGFGVEKTKAEYEDLARAARAAGVSLRQVEEAARQGGTL